MWEIMGNIPYMDAMGEKVMRKLKKRPNWFLHPQKKQNFYTSTFRVGIHRPCILLTLDIGETIEYLHFWCLKLLASQMTPASGRSRKGKASTTTKLERQAPPLPAGSDNCVFLHLLFTINSLEQWTIPLWHFIILVGFDKGPDFMAYCSHNPYITWKV